MAIPTLFEVCTPRADVLQGHMAESDFAADLAQVLKGQAPPAYQDAALFFANTHPTRGLQNLLKNVCLRLSGRNEQVASIFRLDTNYGGGKTHSLIALAHAARGMRGVANKSEFMDPELIPAATVRVAAFDGENADPINGHTLGDGVVAHTPWGELAYALGGSAGFNRIQKSDSQRVAPGAAVLSELMGDTPTLILIDELSIYLRKQGAKDMQMAAKQLTAFLTALFKAVESSPCTALVFTLAIGKKDEKAIDAYSQENQAIVDMMREAESVSARKATLLDPTEEDETVQVLRRRLFDHVDEAGAQQIAAAYARLWDANKDYLPEYGLQERTAVAFRQSFPLHPDLITTLKEKTSTLSNFQRVRGMLRLLGRTIARLWALRPQDAYAVHVHHIDLAYSPIRQEILTKLGQSAFSPALCADIAAPHDAKLSLAQEIDARCYLDMPPYASYVAKTIFLNTLAFNENLKGATENTLRYAMLSPGTELSFIDDAIRRFKQESAYLDDRPNRPLRFMAEPNLTMMIQNQERNIDPGDVRARLNDSIKEIFRGDIFSTVVFPSMSGDIDDTSTEKPQLVVMGYEACPLLATAAQVQVPELIDKMFCHKNSEGLPRINRNNLVFIVADQSRLDDMKNRVRRRLALEDMRNPALQQDLAAHQKEQLNEQYRKSEQEVALCIQQAYRHVFYPSKEGIAGSVLPLAHTTIELQNASANPGSGQRQVVRVLQGVNKIRLDGDNPDSPLFIINRTPLKKGQITTSTLFNEYRRDPALPMLAGLNVFLRSIRTGIEQGEFVYKNGDLVCGKGDPFPSIEINEQAQVLTSIFARENKIWPKPVEPSNSLSPGTDTGTGGIAAKPTPSYSTSVNTNTENSGGLQEGLNPYGEEAAVSQEGVLKEALAILWEKARQKHFLAIATLDLKIYDAQDAFTLLAAVASLSTYDKRVQLEVNFETSDHSTISISLNGSTASAQQLKDFLQPQLRAALDKEFSAIFTICFANGLSLAETAPEDLAEKLTRIGGVTAYVTATAQRQGA